MQQGRGVDELNRRGELDVVLSLIPTHPRRGEGEHGTQAFAAGPNKVLGHLRNPRRMFRRHARGDKVVHRRHVIGQFYLQFRKSALICHTTLICVLDARVFARYSARMKEIFRTTDPTEITFAQALLKGEDIQSFVFDEAMGAFYGGSGLFPRRVMVADDDESAAREVLRENGLDVRDR